MTDFDRDPLIDELRAALDVAPSAEFGARVRIASQLRSPRVWLWTTAAGAGVVASLAVLAVWTMRPVPEPAPVASRATIAHAEPPTFSVAVSDTVRHAKVRQRRGVAGAVTQVEVLVPIAERQAIATLVRQMESGEVDLPAKATTGGIEPAPLEVRPIDLSKQDGGRGSSADQGRVR